jgi:hypothetical protein
MAPELATNYPSMKAAGMVPTLFSKMVRGQLYASTCLPKITTSGYLGELKNEGDTVEIATSPRVLTAKYRRGQKIDFNTAVGEKLTLTVDKSRYWTQFYDRLDLKQTHLKMMQGDASKNAASQISVDIEQEFFTAMPAMAHEKNVGAAAGAKSGLYKLGTAAAPQILSAKNTAAFISQFFSVIAEQNMTDGDGGKSVVCPEWARHYLVNSPDLKDASAIGEKSTLRTNRLGMIFGIEVYTSNLLEPIPVSRPDLQGVAVPGLRPRRHQLRHQPDGSGDGEAGRHVRHGGEGHRAVRLGQRPVGRHQRRLRLSGRRGDPGGVLSRE